jgi:branched-chain amino acid transport system permease protein
MEKHRRFGIPLGGIVVALACLIPLVVTNDYYLRVLVMALLYSIVALSINLIVGISGQLDFGRSAFIGLGAFWSAILMQRFGAPFWIAFLTAGLFCTVVGAGLGLLCRKSTFDYLTLITIGFNEICRLIFLNWQDVTGGAMGLRRVPVPSLFGYVFDTHVRYFYFALALLAICYVAIQRIIKSKLGRAFEALRDDPIAAAYAGIPVPTYKVINFAVASFFTGIAGSAMVHYTQYASPYNYTMDESIYILQMAILGGLGSLPGSILGTAILVIAPEISRTFYEYRLMFVGFMMVVMMIWAPNGILGKQGVGERVIGLGRFLPWAKPPVLEGREPR